MEVIIADTPDVRQRIAIQPIQAVSGRELAIERARQLAAKLAGGSR